MIFPLLAALALTVQPEGGALSLSIDGKPVITGVPTASGLKAIKAEVKQDSPGHYTVNFAYPEGSSAVYTCALHGEDCTLECTFKNGTIQAQTLDLGGLTCTLTPEIVVKGTLSSWHWTYYANHGVWHPSTLNPLGAVYASDGQTAAVFYSPSEFERQSLLNARWTADGKIPNPFQPELHTLRTVAPGATGTASLVIRLTHDLSPKGLYSGYKALLDQRFPKPLYRPDPHPAVAFASVSDAWVRPDNPHGFNQDFRRIDLPGGVAAYLHRIADPLRDAHGMGVIFWAPGGADPVMYPPDFDVNLERIADTWPLLVAGLKERGLRAGLCARAAEAVDRSDPAHPVVSAIDPENKEQVDTLLDRFRHVARMGVNAYYLDTFGNNWSSTRLLPMIRELVGADVPIYTEYSTDMTMPYADRYCEYHQSDTVTWDSPEQFTALRFLFPDSVWLCQSRTPEFIPAAFSRLGLTPLVQDSAGRGVFLPVQ